MPDKIAVRSLADITENTMVPIQLAGMEIVLTRVNGTVYAFDGTCPHSGGPLADGSLSGFTVQCPLHGACFDIRTGEHTSGPGFEGITTMKTSVEDGIIYLELPT